MGINVQKFSLGPIDTNCYVIYNDNKNAVIVDLEEGYDVLNDFVKSNGLNVQMILATHPHFDHLRGMNSMRDDTGAKIAVAKSVVEYDKNGKAYFRHDHPSVVMDSVNVDIMFEDGDILYLDDTPIEIYVGSGHSKADCVFKIEDNLFTGDALFYGTIGRTDLDYGDYNSLVKFVRGLKRFPENTKVYPGHGWDTTIGAESKTNKYMMGE